MITQPGIYADMPSADYFADPCPSPSLTQSLAKLLIDRSPRHVWHAHPRLNSAYEPDESTRFSVGNAAHWHLIGRGKQLAVVDAADWRTKDAKNERERLRGEGLVPVLREQYERAGDMAEAALDQLAALGLADEWHPDAGIGEAVIAWRDGAIWMRAMIDWLPHHRRIVWDYKTTQASAAPHALANKMAADGWCIQAAMHERGLDALDPGNAGRRRHLFVCQECEPPYALTVSEIPEGALHIGRAQLAHAKAAWDACMASGHWPGYPLEIVVPDYPDFMANRWFDREVEAGRRNGFDPEIRMAG
jgi:hypothetical protein